jgi:hypothetical protein
MCILIALLIYIGIVGTSNIGSYWDKGRNTIYKPMESITYYRFRQIKQYFHVLPPITTEWYMKLEPLASLLCTKFQAYVVLEQNVSFDEMMVLFAGRSKHMLKMKNKSIKEGLRFGHFVIMGIYRISFFILVQVVSYIYLYSNLYSNCIQN